MRRLVPMLVVAAFASGPLWGGERVDVNRELRLLELGQTPPRRIAGAALRVAVFTFEDPDGTGLGDSAAALVERAILTGNSASSLGVLRYEGDLAPARPGDLGYFDKVERVVASQDVSLAVWGRISRARGELAVDTLAQVPAKTVESRFTWRLRLPQAMGGESLLARLRPNRFPIQRVRLPLASADAIRAAAQRMDQLRAAPADAAAVVGSLPRERVYTVMQRQGDWVRLQVRAGPGGWARMPECAGECGRLLAAATFAAGLLRFLDQGSAPPEVPGLTAEALAVRDQLTALDSLNDVPMIDHSLALARSWSARRTPAGHGGAQPTVPAGGAASANVIALAEVSRRLAGAFGPAHERTRPELDALRRGVVEGRIKRPAGVPEGPEASQPAGPLGLSPLDVGLIYDRTAVDRAELRAIAARLADAALVDPRNQELLHNIAVLFRASGDRERADKAESLARQASR
jgi:hypothetical protein